MEANANHKGFETPDATANHANTGTAPTLNTDKFARGVEKGIANLEHDAAQLSQEAQARLRSAAGDLDAQARKAEKDTSGVLGGLFGGGSKDTTQTVKDAAGDAANSASQAARDAENKAGGFLNSLFGGSKDSNAAADATAKASETFGSAQSAAIDRSDVAAAQPTLTERIFGSSTTSSSTSKTPAEAEREAIQRASDTFGSTQSAAIDANDLPGQGRFSNRAGTGRSIGDDVADAAHRLQKDASQALDSAKHKFEEASSTPSRSAFGYVDADSVPGQTTTFKNNAESAPFSSDHGTARIASTLNPSGADVRVDDFSS